MKSIIFLVSGGGGNLKFLYLAMRLGMISDIKLTVVADRECPALEFAKENGLDNHLVKYRRNEPQQLCEIIENGNPDVIVTNWHKIIDPETVKKFSGKMINLHYSLLPAFSGMIGIEPIKKAYERGCKFIGATCHYVDEGVDTGKIISQSIFTTDRPLEDSIRLMFQKGCLTLLAGIQSILDDKELCLSDGFIDDSILPNIYYNKKLFDNNFWEMVSKL